MTITIGPQVPEMDRQAISPGKDREALPVEKRIQELIQKQNRLVDAIAKLNQPDAASHVHTIRHEDLLHSLDTASLTTETEVEHIKQLLKQEVHATILIHHDLLSQQLSPQEALPQGSDPSPSSLRTEYEELKNIHKRLCQEELVGDLAEELQKKGINPAGSLGTILSQVHEKLEKLHTEILRQEQESPVLLNDPKQKLSLAVQKANSLKLPASELLPEVNNLKQYNLTPIKLANLDIKSLTALLKRAIQDDNADIVRLLMVEWHVDVNIPDSSGMTPLMIAIQSGKDDLVRLLVLEGHADVNRPDSSGITPLMLAVQSGKAEVAKLLLLEGHADVNISDSSGRTPLILAIQSEQDDLVKLLVREGQADVNISDFSGRLPLMLAVQSGKNDLIRFLVTEGQASLGISDSSGITPLIHAIQSDNADLVRLFVLEGHADVNISDSSGMTPLMLAMQLGKDDLVRLLVTELHADVNRPNTSGLTPIMFAVQLSKDDLIKLLVLEGGASVDKPDANGLTPLIVAITKGNATTVALLIQLGANLDETESLIRTKGLAAIFGLAGIISYTCGTTQLNLDLEGFQSNLALYFLEDYTQHWLASNPLPNDESESIREIIEQATQGQGLSETPLSDELISQNIQAGKPVFMASTAFSGHNIGLLFYKNQFFVCNRGFGGTLHTTEIFEMGDRSLFTTEVIGKLKRARFTNKDDFLDLLSTLNLHSIGGINQKMQKVGNCSWANTKAGMLALIYATLENRFPDPTARLAESKRLYRTFTIEARKKALDEYLDSPNPSVELLKKIRSKIQSPDFSHFTDVEKEDYTKRITQLLPPEPPTEIYLIS